jgi:membrane-bound lytic murein transglycosylase D
MANEETIYAQSEIKKHEPEPVLSASQESVPEGKVAKTTWETGWKTHKVRKGESLGSIADKYDVSLAELRKWNKIKSTKIVAGQSLKVQTKVKKTVYVNDENYTSNKQPEKVQTAEVKPAQESSEEENYQEEAKAEVKDVAVTKPVKSAKPQYKYYVVQKGDTLSKIANSKGVSVDQIKDLNSGLKENKLAIGQKIKIKQI